MIKSKSCFSYLYSEAIALNAFVLSTVQNCGYVSYHLCESAGIGVCIFVLLCFLD